MYKSVEPTNRASQTASADKDQVIELQNEIIRLQRKLEQLQDDLLSTKSPAKPKSLVHKP